MNALKKFRYNKAGKMMYIIKMAMAVLGAFLVANILCFFYYNPARAITNWDAFTIYQYMPHNNVYYGCEGFGISQTDEYGFYNDGNVTFDNANIVCIGSSQTEAIQVGEKDKYVSQLNGKDEHNHAYNLGVSGQFFEKYCSRLPIIPQIFPSARLIIAETPHLPTENDLDKIIESLSSGNVPIWNNEWKENSSFFKVYRSIPYTGLLRKQLTGLVDVLKNSEEITPEISTDMVQYTSKANKTMELLRQKMGNIPLIFLYVPHMDMDRKGQVSVVEDKAKIVAVEGKRQNILCLNKPK